MCVYVWCVCVGGWGVGGGIHAGNASDASCTACVHALIMAVRGSTGIISRLFAVLRERVDYSTPHGQSRFLQAALPNHSLHDRRY